MEYKQFEAKFREFLFYYLKERTGAFLDIVDTAMANDNISVGASRTLDQIKNRGKKQFMELQNAILAGAKCIMETGDVPRGIDKRATSGQSDRDYESPN